MHQYLIDTNILIYHLAEEDAVELFFQTVNPLEDVLLYSFITRIELLGFPDLTDSQTQKINLLLTQFEKVDMNKEIENITIQLRSKKKIKIPDAIIAASAFYTNSTLVTRNVDNFKNIDGLEICNPFVSPEFDKAIKDPPNDTC